MPDPAQPGPVTLEKLASLAKRRGFIFQSSEIYGGMASTWDYGPLGVQLKRNVKDAWWQAMVRERDDIVGLDAAILMHPRVWEASGHVAGFTDPLVDCKQCRNRFRADDPALPSGNGALSCPSCGSSDLTEARMFNLMFKTHVGPVEDDAATAFLRPETAQGIFVNFENVRTTTRKKLPFGIAQQGKSFRNEITTGNFIFRSREFEQMEMEYFVKPGEDEEWFEYWVKERFDWWTRHGIDAEKLRIRPHDPDELSHYSKGTSDIEYAFPWGWGELEGIANRGAFDLTQHGEYSGKALKYFDDESKESFIPYVIEPASGADRGVLAFLADAYDEEQDKDEVRVVLRFSPSIAPVKVAVLPLSRKEPLRELARSVYDDLRGRWDVQYDDAQSIGRRYRRQDEIGTPLCVTVDFDSLDDHQATVRERDSMEQVRLPIADLAAHLSERLDG